MKKVVITGSAGFIGFHTTKKFLDNGWKVVGIDSINDYYDPKIKMDRNKLLLNDVSGNYSFAKIDISDKKVKDILDDSNPDLIVNLAAQAGVRHSIEHPEDYLKSNIDGFLNILEFARESKRIDRVIYASTSSVYGGNLRSPFSETHPVDHPLQFYAVTKKTNELMAHAYSNLYGLSCIGLRFFTVYGPWGRPDMAPMLFAKAILAGEPIKVFNHGQMARDFTYIDDIVEGVVRVLAKPATPSAVFDTAQPDPATSWAPHRLFNIGNSAPTQLLDFIAALEAALGRKSFQNLQPMQPGDVEATAADTAALEHWVGFRPSTPIIQGVRAFAEWYRQFYKI